MSDYAFNRQASYDYAFLETYEAGLVLSGQEVKSVRGGHISLQGVFVVIKGEEAWLLNATIAPYQAGNVPADYSPTRSRKLLLHKNEIRSLIGSTKQTGLTLVPIRVYNKSGKIKLEFALGRGKRTIDKRDIIGKRESDRRIRRAVRGKIE
ncbi:MAG: SsrA-binding protein SmpB [Candidatus Portnoybacteria bacterium]|nr:SsrA-binding protein SmpB [Candidatus Portnoybacteria bacterium]MDD4982661.1 SsrA-binding protein SmpB [Candidatus Portnoybacteria bacterium]